MEESQDAESLEHARARLAVLDAVAAALGRYPEVIQAIAASADREAATDAVGRLLDIGAPPARAVLELQWARLTRDTPQLIELQRAQIRRELGEFGD